MIGLVPWRVLVALVLAFAPMGAEAIYSRRQESRLRARGAVEPPDDVYRVMAWAYPGAFLVMVIEGLWWARGADETLYAGLGVWAFGKALKYAAIRSLGPFWSFRVLVVPGAELVSRGPYRYLRHPNYVGIVGELAGVALIAFAPVAGPAGTLGFVWLLRRRVQVEVRALGLG